jgi:hypothetical protein
MLVIVELVAFPFTIYCVLAPLLGFVCQVSPRFMSRVLFWYATDDASDAARDAHFA